LATFKLKKEDPLFPMPVNIPEPGPYYTCLVSMTGVPTFPYDYALYFSPDHHRGEGGIWLYLCNGEPTVSSNWVSYEHAVEAGKFDHLEDKPEANPIYQDPVQGSGHTETPHANVIDGLVYLTYHKNGIDSTQRTLLATSPDGVNFKRINGDADSVILTYDQTEGPGEGHTGYFRWSTNRFPDIDQKFVGYSLHGGGDDYHSAIWASNDAISWERLDILTPIEGFALDGSDHILIWHEMDPSSITPLGSGEFVAICGVGNRASGGDARITELYEVFLAGDGRTPTRKCRRILGVGDQNSQDAEELSSPTSVIIGDECHLIYVGASQEGSVNTVIGAKGEVNRKSRKSAKLRKSEQRKHIYQQS
jgi:hypothetical protein